MKRKSGERVIFPTCLEHFMKEYQRTQAPEFYHRVIFRVSKLMIRMIWQEKRRHPELMCVKNQELYHIAIIALHDAILKFDFNKATLYAFPSFLQGYFRNNLQPIIREERRCVPSGIEATTFENEAQSCEIAYRQKEWLTTKIMLDMAIEKVRKRYRMPEVQWKAFKLRYENGWTYEKIAKEVGRSKNRVKQWVDRISDRIRVQIGNFKKI